MSRWRGHSSEQSDRSVPMPALTPAEISAIDAAHVWHPYSTIGAEALPPVVAVAAKGAWLTLVDDGRPRRGPRRDEFVVDGDPRARPSGARRRHSAQLATMNHVMFGGLTHEPAARLAQLLVEITPAGLDSVFFSDSVQQIGISLGISNLLRIIGSSIGPTIAGVFMQTHLFLVTLSKNQYQYFPSATAYDLIFGTMLFLSLSALGISFYLIRKQPLARP